MPSSVPGYLRIARRLRSRSVAIVMYHGVIQHPLSVWNWTQLDIGKFEQQIEFLSREYTVLPLPEVLEALTAGKSLPDRAAAVTFDDGFRNIYTAALPVLKKYKMPFTVFVVTSLIGTSQPPWTGLLSSALMETEETVLKFGGVQLTLATPQGRAAAYSHLSGRLKRVTQEEKEDQLQTLFCALKVPSRVPPDSPFSTLGWEDIMELSHTGLALFGSHTHTHAILSRCGRERQEEELRISRDILQERLGRIDLFAYPNGSRADFTDTTKKLLVNLGYRCGLATIPGINQRRTDLYELKRVNVGADITLKDFELRMMGW